MLLAAAEWHDREQEGVGNERAMQKVEKWKNWWQLEREREEGKRRERKGVKGAGGKVGGRKRWEEEGERERARDRKRRGKRGINRETDRGEIEK